MDLIVNDNSYIVFDLDDTLYLERNFVESGFRYIESLLIREAGRPLIDEMMERFDRREDVFAWLIGEFALSPDKNKAWLLEKYRTHSPDIQLGEDVKVLLSQLRSLGVPMGLMTDGRSVTQRNKIAALGIEDDFADILISEEFGSAKPDPRNYRFFAEKYPGRDFTFFGDNTGKDFIVPAQLGWTTVCLKCSGNNIHAQDFSVGPRPDFIIESFRDVRVVPDA